MRVCEEASQPAARRPAPACSRRFGRRVGRGWSESQADPRNACTLRAVLCFAHALFVLRTMLVIGHRCVPGHATARTMLGADHMAAPMKTFGEACKAAIGN